MEWYKPKVQATAIMSSAMQTMYTHTVCSFWPWKTPSRTDTFSTLIIEVLFDLGFYTCAGYISYNLCKPFPLAVSREELGVVRHKTLSFIWHHIWVFEWNHFRHAIIMQLHVYVSDSLTSPKDLEPNNASQFSRLP